MKLGALLITGLVCMGAAANSLPSELFDYLANTSGQASWSVGEARRMGAATVQEIRLVSQEWRDVTWEHRLLLCLPPRLLYPDKVLLYVSGDPSPQDELLALQAAVAVGAPVAVLNDVPVQPLFGLREDALVAHTYERYLEEGDPDWPLLLPMVRSAHAAMDALQALGSELWGGNPDGFVVLGASKRGWTAYLTAATARERVIGLVPMVFDVLNMALQMDHQLDVWGEYSPQIQDYVERGLMDRFKTPDGARLLWLVDPYSYRYALTQPKLIVLGSNDPYWPITSLPHYWAGLPDPKALLVVPNVGHGLGDLYRVSQSIAAFGRLVLEARSLPSIEAAYFVEEGRVRVSVRVDDAPSSVTLWKATGTSRDFRNAVWESVSLRQTGGAWERTVELPQVGHIALFAEAIIPQPGGRLYVSSVPQVTHVCPP